MTYPEALDYLNSFLNYEQVVRYRYRKAFRLDRIRELLDRLGNPHRRFLSLHVAGTKGKGSTCAFAASILQAAGYRVGLYTSPHLITLRERIQIDGQPISEKALAGVADRIRPLALQDVTFFEVTTACAFRSFAEEEVDVAVVEVGLGGRLDATNVLEPEVTAITPISLDHVMQLGSTIASIAREKAGIIKPRIPVVVAPQAPEADSVLARVACLQKAPVHRVEEEITIDTVEGGRHGSRFTFWTPSGEYRDVEISLMGRHQVINAVTAVRMVELLSPGDRHRPISPHEISQGLARAVWPGRCQLVEGDPPILLDGAQNATSAKALRETVEELFPGKSICLLLGVSLGKDLAGIASILGPWADQLILTQADVPRAESPQRLAQILRPWHPDLKITDSVAKALEHAKQVAAPSGLIVVTGSLFVAGEALSWLHLPAISGACPDAVPEKVSRR